MLGCFHTTEERLTAAAERVLWEWKLQVFVPTRRQKEAPKQPTPDFLLSVLLYFIELLLGGGKMRRQPHDPLFYLSHCLLLMPIEVQEHMHRTLSAMSLQDIALQAF
jgi:hypothetical protein